MTTNFPLVVGSIALALFFGMLALQEMGRRWGLKRAAEDPETGHEGLGGVEGAVYGLLGLLIAFSFSGAASRFETRRDLIIDEANAIGTAYLRLDVLPAEAQPAMRDKFRRYVDSRLEAYRKLPDVAAAHAELARSVVLQGELWQEAVAATRAPGSPSPLAVLPPLNEMFDIASTRTAATQAHTPFAIFAMLVVLALVSAFMVGFGMAGSKDRSGIHMLAYAAVLASVIYVIFDLEHPRLGLIRVDAADQVLIEVRESMK
jgi:hypothetical protein